MGAFGQPHASSSVAACWRLLLTSPRRAVPWQAAPWATPRLAAWHNPGQLRSAPEAAPQELLADVRNFVVTGVLSGDISIDCLMVPASAYSTQIVNIDPRPPSG